MNWLDFILGMVTVVLLFVGFIAWIGVKYDVIDRDKKTKELELEILKLKNKPKRKSRGKNNVQSTK